jgi:4-amino-4-deoxy-L-arabinose transferase-like glycosyltransferase
MQASWFQRLGLTGAGHDERLAVWILAVALGLYCVGYAAFYPHGPTNDDEGLYLEQTQLWVETGSFRTEKLHPVSGEAEEFVPGDYPVGMVALMAPFVSALGWRGGFLPSFLCFLLAVIATAWWLRDERRSPLFALILLAFPAALVAGRLAMSDAPRTAAAAVGLWFFFRGIDRGAGWWLASGFIAGSALTLRESAVLPFILFFAGTVLRGDRGWGWLLLGGLLGTGLHLGLNQLAFGDALFVRGASTPYHLALDTLHERLPLYLLGLLVLVPGGLFFGLAYRGRRRAEVVLTIAAFFLFYLLQAYGMSASSFVKRLVIALRYFDPLLPVLAIAMAESVPRLLATAVGTDATRQRLVGRMAGLWVAAVLAVSFVVHPVLARWGADQASIRAAITEAVPNDAVLIANGTAIRKFIDDLARTYVTLHRDRVSPDELQVLRKQHGGFMVALLDRSDSDYWREDAARNAAFIAALGDPAPLVDLQATGTDRLRIWRIGEPAP